MCVVEGAMSIAGGAMEAEQAKANAKNARQMAAFERANAEREIELANQQAKATENEAKERARLQRRENSRGLALNRARNAATGFDYSGTPLLFEIENAQDMELDVLNARQTAFDQAKVQRYNGQVKALNHRNNAANYNFRADQYNTAGSWAMTKGIVNGSMQIGKGIAGLGGKWDTISGAFK